MTEVQGTEIIGQNIQPNKTYRMKLYDFKRPDKFSKDQIRTMSIMHETFSRLTTTSLSVMLRTEVKIHLASVDQMTYEEFLATLPNPAILGIVNMDPLRGSCMFAFSNETGYAIIERAFGGDVPFTTPAREISEIECGTFEEVMIRLLGNFRETWTIVRELRPRLGQIETNKHFCQMIPPTEMIVLTTFECKIGDIESEFHIMYPYITIEPIVHQLSLYKIYNRFKNRPGSDTNVHVGDMQSEIAVAVDGPDLTMRELAELRRGDLLPLAAMDEGSGYILLNGTAVESCTWNTTEQLFDGRFELVPSEEDAETARQERTEDSIPTPPQLPMEPIKELAKEVAAELGKGYRAISTRLDEISGRQEDLTDQIAYSESSESEPREPVRIAPFGYITIDDADSFVPLLGSEHPQTIALVLSYLEPRTAAAILAVLPKELSIDIAERVTSIARIAPETLAHVDRVVRKRFDVYLQSEFTRPGGVKRIVEILNLASRSVEKEIIEALEDRNGELAEEIKKRMFVFEDIVLLSKKAVAAVVEKADDQDLALALRGVSEEVKTHVYAGMDSGKADSITALMKEMGPARLTDVERAQMSIVSIIRKLEHNGVLHIARADEEIV